MRIFLAVFYLIFFYLPTVVVLLLFGIFNSRIILYYIVWRLQSYAVVFVYQSREYYNNMIHTRTIPIYNRIRVCKLNGSLIRTRDNYVRAQLLCVLWPNNRRRRGSFVHDIKYMVIYFCTVYYNIYYIKILYYGEVPK